MDIALKGIEKSFGETKVLNGIDIAIMPGEFVTLVGASGCGKSTLLRVLAGLENPDAGQVMVAGKNLTQVRPADRDLAMVFQSYALYPHLSVAENMATPLRLRNLSWRAKVPVFGPFLDRSRHRDIHQQVLNAAEVLKITHLLDRKPGQLSGGQRQRVALGRALVRNPVAFLMDEPLSNLDAALRVHMRAELDELHRRLATTFVYVTHDQSEALTLSDRLAVMVGGKILQFGSPDEVYNNSTNIDVAQFIGSPPINVLTGAVSQCRDLSLLGEVIGQANTEATFLRVGIRAEDVSLSHDGSAATVIHRENLGSDVYLHCRITQTDESVIIRAPAGNQSNINDTVRFQFNQKKVLVFNEQGIRVAITPRHTASVSASSAEYPAVSGSATNAGAASESPVSH